MRPIPQKIRREIRENSSYHRCMLRAHPDHECGGRITMEHALIFAGRQLNEPWAIIAICARGHEVDEYQDAGTMDKNLNRWVALNRAPEEELRKYSKAVDLVRECDRLNAIYGEYREPEPVSGSAINYPI